MKTIYIEMFPTMLSKKKKSKSNNYVKHKFAKKTKN